MSDAATLDFVPGRFGLRTGAPGLRVRQRLDVELASVLARRDQAGAAAVAAERAFGVQLPDQPRAVTGRDVTFVWSGPGHWTALAQPWTACIEARIAGPLSGLVSVFDQSGSRVLLELQGPKVRDVLAKGVSIDLHPRAFDAGQAALTTVSNLGVLLWQATDAPLYRLLVARTYFGALWRWLADAAAEYGGEILDPRPFAAGTE